MTGEDKTDTRLDQALDAWGARLQQPDADELFLHATVLKLRRREHIRRWLPLAIAMIGGLVVLSTPAAQDIAHVWQQIQATITGWLRESPWLLLATALAVGTASSAAANGLDPAP